MTLSRTATDTARILTSGRLTLAVAESCTGGLLTHSLTNVPGSSLFLKAGLVCYANEAKIRVLGVPPSLLTHHGAVSAATAQAMARGVRCRIKADIGIGITGIAGPGGGTEKKPVGLVFIAAASARKTIFKKFIFKGTRLQIKEQAARAALLMLRSILITR
jgi:PncC family amidohydrolase